MKSNLTVIIPCKNEGFGVIECLKLIQYQTYLPDTVIIADSSDGVDKFMLHNWCMDKNWIHIADGGTPAVARNTGAKMAATDYILFIDADIMLYDRRIIEVAMSRMNEFDLLTARVLDTDGKWNWVWRMFGYVQKAISKKMPFALGGFQLWKADVFFELGGFDPNIKVAEDWMLSKKVNPKRFKILDRYIHTSGRRFNSNGISYMFWLMIKSWVNRNNPQWFYSSHNYWK